MFQHIIEPQPPEEMMNITGMKDEMRRPMMLLISARKRQVDRLQNRNDNGGDFMLIIK